MYLTTVSSQGQTSIPVAVRRRLGLEEGDELMWQIVSQSGNLYAKIVSPSLGAVRSLRGSAKNLYKDDGGGINYLKKERKSWKKNLNK